MIYIYIPAHPTVGHSEFRLHIGTPEWFHPLGLDFNSYAATFIAGYLRVKQVGGPSLLPILIFRVVTRPTLASRKPSVISLEDVFLSWMDLGLGSQLLQLQWTRKMRLTCHVQASVQSLFRHWHREFLYRSIGRVSESCSTEQFVFRH